MDTIKIKDLAKDEIPMDLAPGAYFNTWIYHFEHHKLLSSSDPVFQVLDALEEYCAGWIRRKVAGSKKSGIAQKAAAHESTLSYGRFDISLEDGAVFRPARIQGSESGRHSIYLGRNARVIGADLYPESGDIYIGADTVLEPGAGIKGPCIIGRGTRILQGAYLRGNCILGNHCVFRGEMKNSVIMDEGVFPHICYLGDSLCGYRTHFGNQVTAANLGIFEGMKKPEEFRSIEISCNGIRYDTGRTKLGVIMGDLSQIGCNSVTDPGTFLKPSTIVYAQMRVPEGFYGPAVVIKSNPSKQIIFEQVPLKPIK